jgi:hypothetical protein
MCEGEMAMCQSEEGERWDHRAQTVVFQVAVFFLVCLRSLPSTACLYSDTPPSHPPFIRLAQTIFGPNLFLFKYPRNLILVILPAYTAYEDRTDRVFRNVGV